MFTVFHTYISLLTSVGSHKGPSSKGGVAFYNRCRWYSLKLLTIICFNNNISSAVNYSDNHSSSSVVHKLQRTWTTVTMQISNQWQTCVQHDYRPLHKYATSNKYYVWFFYNVQKKIEVKVISMMSYSLNKSNHFITSKKFIDLVR